MKLSFKSKKLEKALTEDKTCQVKFGNRARKIRQRMNELKAARTLQDLKAIPQLRLHEHKGPSRGTWTIDIFKNWRIYFELEHDPLPHLEDGGIDLNEITDIRILKVEDPH